MKVAIAICIFCQFFSMTMKSALAKELPEEVTVSLLGPDYAPLPPQKTATVKKSDEEWLKQLGPERFRILQDTRNRAAFLRDPLGQQENWNLSLRRLRTALVFIAHKVQFRHRMA